MDERKRKGVLLGMLLVVAAGAGALQYTRHLEQQRLAEQRAAAMKAAQERAEAWKSRKAEEAKQPGADVLATLLPPAFPRSASLWKSTEKAAYEELLSKGSFDVLLVPFQAQQYALDRPTRSLMSAQLARIAQAKLKVPDPYLVARALGDGERRFAADDVYRLAYKLNVKRVVWGYVGYDGQYKLRVLVQVQAPGQGGRFYEQSPLTAQPFEGPSISDDDPPLEAFQRMLPEVARAAGFELPATEAPAPASLPDAALPSTIIGLTGRAEGALSDALTFQLLAALTPSTGTRARERFAEKSMLALQRVSADAPGYRYLKARGLMLLGARPAALKALGTPQSAEEQHLAAVLNGNLPQAEKLALQLKPQSLRLLAHLDVNDIAAEYGVRGQAGSLSAARQLKLATPVWHYILARAMTDWDAWSQHDNLALKQVLDQEAPLRGYALEDIVRAAAAVGDLAKAEAAASVSVLDHVRRLLQAQGDKQCCMGLQASPGLLDYLDLMESIGNDNVLRRARFLAKTQGAPQAALDFIARVDSAYRDHPHLALTRAYAENAMGQRSDGAAREGYLKSAYANAVSAAYWEQGQTPVSAAAFYLKAEMGRADFGSFDNLYASDYPYRAYYPTWQGGGIPELDVRNSKAALRHSTFELQPVRNLHRLLVEITKQPDEFAAIMQSIEGRFAGHPELAAIVARASQAKGDVTTAAAQYRQSIKLQPEHWDAYKALGTLLFEEGQGAQAADVFLSYPAFKPGAEANRVQMSNHAYEAGSMFFWSGDFKRATPLYRIAADLATGSDASITSALRIGLMNADMRLATALSLDRARRYSSPFAYRDYLGLLHALGHSKEAWDGFNLVARQLDRPQVWETALVGHRLQGLSEKQVAEWSSQDDMRALGRYFGYASMHLLRAAVVDRRPSAELPATLAAMERPVWQVAPHGHVVRPTLEGDSERVLGPNAAEPLITLPLGVFRSSPRARVKSDLLYFAEAYLAIRTGDFDSARATLEEAVKLYDVRNVHVGYLLPYLALAAARSGKADAVRALLEKQSAQYQRFDHHLAKASLAALDGREAEALESLRLALHRRPFTENRPMYTEYQYAEICEWLFEATRNPKYRDVALDWARRNQVFQPWFAWPYAMEAKLSPDGRQRKRAIAMAYFLDRNSERLKTVPASQVKAAVKEFGALNPFRAPPGSKPEST